MSAGKVVMLSWATTVQSMFPDVRRKRLWSASAVAVSDHPENIYCGSIAVIMQWTFGSIPKCSTRASKQCHPGFPGTLRVRGLNDFRGSLSQRPWDRRRCDDTLSTYLRVVQLWKLNRATEAPSCTIKHTTCSLRIFKAAVSLYYCIINHHLSLK